MSRQGKTKNNLMLLVDVIIHTRKSARILTSSPSGVKKCHSEGVPTGETTEESADSSSPTGTQNNMKKSCRLTQQYQYTHVATTWVNFPTLRARWSYHKLLG